MTAYVGDKTLSDLQVGPLPVQAIHLGTTSGSVEVWRRAMEWEEITFSSMLTAPAWAAWVDIVVLGAGGGGSGGNSSNRTGNGGQPGGWAHSTFDMLPGRDLNIDIGEGGRGGSAGGGAGVAGGPTRVSTSFNNWSVTGVGGAGGTGAGGAAGGAPVVWDAYKRAFSGGGAQPAMEAAGNAPGGGGGPGKGASWSGSKAGGPGARGHVWIRWRSY